MVFRACAHISKNINSCDMLTEKILNNTSYNQHMNVVFKVRDSGNSIWVS